MKLVGLTILMLVNFTLSKTIEQLCRDQEGASQDDMRALRENRAPKTRLQKCYYDCVFQQAGFSDGRRFLKEGYKQRISEMPGESEAMKASMKRVADGCDGIENEDRCELAAEIDACVMKR